MTIRGPPRLDAALQRREPLVNAPADARPARQTGEVLEQPHTQNVS